MNARPMQGHVPWKKKIWIFVSMSKVDCFNVIFKKWKILVRITTRDNFRSLTRSLASAQQQTFHREHHYKYIGAEFTTVQHGNF